MGSEGGCGHGGRQTTVSGTREDRKAVKGALNMELCACVTQHRLTHEMGNQVNTEQKDAFSKENAEVSGEDD